LIVLAALALACLSCSEDDTATAPETPAITLGGLVGRWAEYKCVIKVDYYDSTGRRQRYEMEDVYQAITGIVEFDSVSVRWHESLPNDTCYRTYPSTAFSLDGDALLGEAFVGRQPWESDDTLDISYTAAMVDRELRLIETFSGTANAHPALITFGYYYTAVTAFPLSYWPQVPCL